MKKLLVLFSFFTIFVSCPLFSQDIIIKNDKVEIKAKVIEIQEDLIKYKLFESQEGPVRNIQISDVFMVIYESGKRESFTTIPETKLKSAPIISSNANDKSSQNNIQIKKPITKGNIILGGDFDKATTSLSLSPTFGYFIFNGLVIGLSSSFSYSISKSIDKSSLPVQVYEGHSYGIGISPYIKYYFKSCIFIGLESGFDFSRSFAKYNNSDLKSTSNGFTISPSLGYAIFINPKISIEPCLNYLYNKGSSSPSSGGPYSYQDHTFSFSIGFHIFL
jgi:hypothetical protein